MTSAQTSAATIRQQLQTRGCEKMAAFTRQRHQQELEQLRRQCRILRACALLAKQPRGSFPSS